MIFLFRSGTLREKARLVFNATRQHASNLARFAFLYKASMIGLRKTNGGKEMSAHHFLAGLFGGYWVFGQSMNSVNQQIVIYIFARVVLALAKLAIQPPGDNSLVGSSYGGRGGIGLFKLTPEQVDLVKKYAWPVFASVSWASVMAIFESHPETLQNSLRSSMTYMYVLTFLSIFFSERGGIPISCPFLPATDSGLTATATKDTPTAKDGILPEIIYYTTSKKSKEKEEKRRKQDIRISMKCIAKEKGQVT